LERTLEAQRGPLPRDADVIDGAERAGRHVHLSFAKEGSQSAFSVHNRGSFTAQQAQLEAQCDDKQRQAERNVTCATGAVK
jgi:hypothetical protein